MTERQAALTSYHEYRLRLEGHEKALRERMETARWICYHIYAQNPYIKEPKAHSLVSYIRFPWEEGMDLAEAEEKRNQCHVSEQEQAELDKIFRAVFGEV